MCQFSGVDGFPILRQFGKLNASTVGAGFGTGLSSTQLATIPTKAQDLNEMLLKFNELQSQSVMTKQEALEK